MGYGIHFYLYFPLYGSYKKFRLFKSLFVFKDHTEKIWSNLLNNLKSYKGLSDQKH